ncbi:uncharacterized protein N7459_005641 [Penicillium hispanicum]|uniref:uncharacterized protein n=1 Tax=Penicillium hispanicum TaxID=1080232 RepID=UPI0025410212|nr:uncharacterized protein N7459_005641 [Penicillium hispanicum]KAJ5579656.1 hypothetical protein N7459_005641 [Penicillium hispanicum]
MSLRSPSPALCLSSWLNRNNRPQKLGPRRLLPVLIAAILATSLFYHFLIPQILRLRFRTGLSWYDLGYYGLGPSQGYVSFDEESPIVEISPYGAHCDQRYTFLAPRGDSVAHAGPMILDARGELVWMKYNWGTTQDFKVQRYKGQDYVTFWQGAEEDGHGRGSWYMLDSSYTPKFVVSPVGAMGGDLHEFHITKNDTALVTIYDPIPADLTSVGGPELGWLYDGVVQELDIATGELLFEWRSSSVYPPTSSFEPLKDRGRERNGGYDYFHLNSVDKDDQGRFLISGRHTHTITCVDGSTGQLLWTLGGKNNEFTDASNEAATDFSWQHDARWQGPNSLSVFNNAANSDDNRFLVSHGLMIDLDIPSRKAKVRTTYSHPQDMMAVSQGNMQVLDTGNVLVGWGHSAAFTEFSPQGEVVCDVHFGASAYFSFGRIVSYRVYKGNWVGTPTSIPDAEVEDDTVFVSWNGATEVATWRVEAWDGASLANMTFVTVDQVNRTGFETGIPLTPAVKSYFRLIAINAKGEVLGVTDMLQRDPPRHESSFVSVPWGAVVIVLFAFGCLLLGLYCAVLRHLRRRIPGSRGFYQLLTHKYGDNSDSERGNLPT